MTELLDNLDEAQKQVVTAGEGQYLVIAGPGAGKSTCITRRFARLVERRIPPRQILAVTFTKNAADEMAYRIAKLTGLEFDELKRNVCTFHSLGYRMVLQNKRWLEEKYAFKLADSPINMSKCRYILKQICEDDLGYLRVGRKDARGAITLFKRMDKASEEVLRENPMDKFALIYDAFERAKRAEGLLEFDDMIFYSWRMLRDDVAFRARQQGLFRFVMIDEFHDCDRVQLGIAMELAKPQDNFLAVCDVLQCQPAQTSVVTIGNVSKRGRPAWHTHSNISLLSDGDRVLTWKDRGSYRELPWMKNGRAVSVAKRFYSGQIFRVTAGRFSTRATPNHSFPVWMNKNAHSKRIVYLMYRGDLGFRVGQCRLYNGNSFHGNLISLRVSHEKADRAWVLKVFDSLTEARTYETMVSVRYGIPTTTFEVHHDYGSYQNIAKIFSAADRNGGYTCLLDHGKFFNLPFCSRNKPHKKILGNSAKARHYVCNLIPGVMDVQTIDGKKNISAVKIRKFSGLVYSLDVAVEHNYVADGILTCNSIYGWRGAEPEIAIHFEQFYANFKKIYLGLNYRSIPPVVNLYRDVAAPSPYADKGFLETISPTRTGSHPVYGGTGESFGIVGETDLPTLKIFSHDLGEAKFVAEECKLLRDRGELSIAVLYRMNRQSWPLEMMLIEKGVTYMVQGATSFFHRYEIKNILAFLRVMAKPEDNNAIEQIISGPAPCSKYLGKAFIEALKKTTAKEGGSWLSNIPLTPAKPRQEKIAIQLHSFLEDLIEEYSPGTPPADLLALIVDRTNMVEALTQEEEFEDSADNDIHGNVEALIQAASRYKSVEEFLKAVEATGGMQSREDLENSKPVRLSTIHRSKGLEFDHVYLVGANHDILPHKRASDPEEERRLLYVAVSRARNHLTISCTDAVTPFLEVTGLREQVMKSRLTPFGGDNHEQPTAATVTSGT
jgi:superfamily I DNA/RNA helicase